MSTAHNGTHLSNWESRKHSNRQVSGGPPPVKDAMQNGGEGLSAQWSSLCEGRGGGLIYQTFTQTQEEKSRTFLWQFISGRAKRRKPKLFKALLLLTHGLKWKIFLKHLEIHLKWEALHSNVHCVRQWRETIRAAARTYMLEQLNDFVFIVAH